MGAQSSKIVRKLPTKPQSDTLKRVPKESPSTLVHEASTMPEEVPDKILLQHLNKLGPVSIEPTTTKMRLSDTMLDILSKRRQVVEKELPPGLGVNEDYVSIDSIYALLEQRKHLNPGDIDNTQTRQQIMKQYNISENTLAALLKYYNTIAIMPPVLDDKEERRVGVWVNDRLEWESKVRAVDDKNKAIKKAKEEAMKDNAKKIDHIEKKKEDELKDLFDENY